MSNNSFHKGPEIFALERLDLGTNGCLPESMTATWNDFSDSCLAGVSFGVSTWRACCGGTEGRTSTIGYFTGLMVRKFGFRILGSPFPGWSTDYMGFYAYETESIDAAIRALVSFAFEDLGCVHIEMMDRRVRW